MATPCEAGRPWATSGFMKTPGIPSPSGSYSVGAVDVMTESNLLVKIFYPTHVQPGQGYQYMSCIPDAKYSRALLEIYKIKPAWLMTAIVSKLTGAKSPAFTEAPLYSSTPEADQQPVKYPVIVFSHGLSAHRQIYSGICCDIASHGYVVAAVEHKDLSACLTFNRVPGPGVAEGDYDNYINEWIPYLVRPTDIFPLRNDQVKQRSSEVSKSLDLLNSLNNGEDVKNMMGGRRFDLHQFTGRLDINTAAVMGHSFGGATTVVTLASDNRFKCGIGLDTWMFPIHNEVYEAGIDQPLLFINTFTFQWPENVAKMMRLVNAPNESGVAKCSIVTLKGTTHESQTDAPFIIPSFANKYFIPNIYEANVANADLCNSFLRRHLLKDPAYQENKPILDGQDDHPIIIYGTNVDWKEENNNKDREENTSETRNTTVKENDDSANALSVEQEGVSPHKENNTLNGDHITSTTTDDSNTTCTDNVDDAVIKETENASSEDNKSVEGTPDSPEQ